MAKDIPAIGEAFLGDSPHAQKELELSVGFGSEFDVDIGVQATYALFNVAPGVSVNFVKLYIENAFDAVVTMGIGDGASTSGFIATANIDPDVASSGGIWISSVVEANAYQAGRFYAAADTIDLLLGAADVTVGDMSLVVGYSLAKA